MGRAGTSCLSTATQHVMLWTLFGLTTAGVPNTQVLSSATFNPPRDKGRRTGQGGIGSTPEFARAYGIGALRSGDQEIGGRTGTAVSFLNRGASPMPPWDHVRVEATSSSICTVHIYIQTTGGYIQFRDPAPVTQVLGVGGGAAMGAETPARLKS